MSVADRPPLPRRRQRSVWVFGYGSLVWRPGFVYSRSLTGFLRGFSRKFWQGNTAHRGTPNKPGRVATLIEDNDGVVWGRAFLVNGDDALPYLERRECGLGGYTTLKAKFHPLEPAGQSLDVLVYLATPSNDHWLGEAPDAEIATQILTSSGPTGHNVEYLLRLADFMREEIPGAEDEHLFRLERLVRAGIRERKLSIGRLMGHAYSAEPPPPQPPTNQNNAPLESQLHSSRVDSKKLRCLGI